MHWWSKEELDYLREQYQLHTIKELLPMFNEQFNVDVSFDQLKGTLSRNKISSGRDGHFSKGHKPFNKGMKGINFGGRDTQFKNGHKPHNYKPVGTERVNGEGYVDVKIADPNKWKSKHQLVWEESNGPIPKGHVIIFGDRNRLNVELDNLILVSRKQLSWLNKRNLIKEDAELTRTGVIIADIYSKISERNKANT